ncbi:hypothetical protein B0T22DRAFT_500321 [Podospora appendiculata]|uniref:Phosphoinositide phospholipase C n=1 Tax=Podospora appendiculata TaxID=314037 RepID=A0AAE0X5R0_9PEZI|nr:hypothetical protein B0T22DRAFT_500321 [Podospora appendiculata]
MTSEPIQSRRSRPSHVRTDLATLSQLTVTPPSAMSNSSVSPNSMHGSSIMTPETAGTNTPTCSSDQNSPELLESFQGRGSDEMDVAVPPLRLPEAVTTPLAGSSLSRRTSTNSLGQGVLRSPGPTAMGEALKSASLIRRASNGVRKAGDLLKKQARRQSSTNPRSRDGSVGPGVVRGRAGSTGNSDKNSPFYSDSEDECAVEKDDGVPLFSGNGVPRDCSPLGAPAMPSVQTPVSAIIAGPVVPLALRRGTALTKISKKKNQKRITLVLNPDSAKIWWDKNRLSKSVYIDDIKEIRTAEDIRQYRLDSGLAESMESRFFSIMYTFPDKSGTKVMHLVADDDETFRNWTETLEAISKHRQDFATSLMAFNDKAIRAYWHREMAKQFGNTPRAAEDEMIDFVGVERMCRSLHIHVAPQQLRQKFDKVKSKTTSSQDLPTISTSSSRLNFAEFLEFVRLMKTRKDIRPVYRRNTSDVEAGMTKEEFLEFLRNVQGENVDEDLAYWENAFSRFARKGKPKDAERQPSANDEGLAMSEAAFVSFLTSTSNVIIPKEPKDYKLDRPLNEYIISSSHNTYLLGRQVAGVSSVEGYISAILRGCRCVEIDCWDGPNDEPIVMHGHTWTTRISFYEVVKAINKYAFLENQRPLWISLEVRCNFANQESMVRMMNEVFADRLVRQPIGTSADRLPTPDELLGRIIIKVKKAQQIEEPAKSGDRLGRRRGNSLPSQYQRTLTMDNTPVPMPSSPLLSPTVLSRSSRQINTITEGEVHEAPSGSPSECESESEKDSAKRSSSKISPVLGELAVYCAGINFEGFDTPEAKTYNHIFSFKERTFADKNQGKGKQTVFLHNMKYLMRVYPNGSRISSNNFDPTQYWKRGVQMVALNWQTFDLGMQLNQAMFASGVDQSGYVLKPIEGREIQRLDKEVADQYLTKRPRKNITFTIDVISAQQLMRPWSFGEKRTLDPYVEVEVFLADDKRNKRDAPEDTQLKNRTQIVRENGFNPEFNGSYTFNVTTKYPDLIFVRWSVKLADKTYNDRTPPLATYTAKFSSLKQGYRTIPLLDHNGDRYLFSTIFCQIKKGQFTEVMVTCPDEAPKNGSKLKNIFSSQPNVSPKSSMETGAS